MVVKPLYRAHIRHAQRIGVKGLSSVIIDIDDDVIGGSCSVLLSVRSVDDFIIAHASRQPCQQRFAVSKLIHCGDFEHPRPHAPVLHAMTPALRRACIPNRAASWRDVTGLGDRECHQQVSVHGSAHLKIEGDSASIAPCRGRRAPAL